MESLDADITDKIIKYLMSRPNSSSMDISNGIGHNRITISKYLEILKAYGAVDYRKSGKSRLWRLKRDKPTILIVDDDLSILNLIKLILSNKYNVITADSGEKAVSEINKANLAIIDLMMPGMSGFELLKEIRKRNLKMPLIVISAMAKMDDKVKALLTGADQYIVKPFDPLELESFVMLALGNQDLNISPITFFPSKRLFLLKMKQLKRKPQYINVIKISDISGKDLVTYIALVGKQLAKYGIVYHPVANVFCLFSDKKVDIDLSSFSKINLSIDVIDAKDTKSQEGLLNELI